MKRLVPIATLLAGLACAGTGAALDLEACRVAGIQARCGTFEVPENRADPDGRRIDLNVVILPAKSKNPEPDPLFFFHGGPGGAATTLAPAFVALPFREDRDIVLVDQRGTGGSNPISCGPDDLEVLLASLARFDLSSQLECLDKLDADPRFYTSREFIADIDAVRVAIGAGRINILGGSYGTRAALEYLVAYPKHSRSAILRGVAPMSFTLPRDFARDSQAALDDVLADCVNDRACAAAYPDLAGKVAAIVRRLESRPVGATIRDPRTRQRIRVTVDREMFAAAIHYTLYSSDLSARLPKMIDAAHGGDFTPLLDSLTAFISAIIGTLSDGLFLSVTCAEDLPFVTDEEFRSLGENTLLGAEFGINLKRTCEHWPHATLPPSIKEQPETAVPILLINGEVDPVTPPHHTEKIMERLPNALHVIVPDTSHADLFPGCVRRLASRFLERGSVEGLSADCIQKRRRPNFVVD
jgi:pimeloyl-ACP methyl ester carboxylesterase